MAKPFRFRHVNEITGAFVLGVIALLVLAVVGTGFSQRWFTRTTEFTLLLPTGAQGLRPGAEVQMLGTVVGSVQDIRVGGRPSSSQYQYTLQGDNLKDLNQWAPRLMRRLQRLPQLRDVSTDQQDRGLEAYLAVERDTASRLGVTAQAVDEALYDAFGQRQVSTIFTQLNQYRVVLESEPQFQTNPQVLSQIYVNSPSGQQVPLRALVDDVTKIAPIAINHQGQFPSVTLSFNLQPGVSLGTAVTAIH